MAGRVRSGGFQHGHYDRGAVEKEKPAVVGGDMLIGAGAGTKQVSHFIVALTEAVS
jgi:hypothetical protein